MKKLTRVLLAGALTVFLGGRAAGQRAQDPGTPPDAPKPKQEQGQEQGEEKSKNPLESPIGLIARKSYVYPELATTRGPLTSREKFELFLSKASSPPQILSSVVDAAIGQARNSLPGYGQGWNGYASRFGSSMASGASSHFFGTYLWPALLRDDPRFFVRLNGGWRGRVGHALARVVVIRTDAGGSTFNIPGTLGPLMAEGLANVYLPQGERTAAKTFERFGIRIGWGAANNLFKEYWPSIFKSLRIDKVAPDLNPQTPAAPPSGKSPSTP